MFAVRARGRPLDPAAFGAAATSGDRSAKIRTYNYPQGRVTDHRINLTVHDLQRIMDGDIGKIIEALQEAADEENFGDE